jgi:hypothetical protein
MYQDPHGHLRHDTSRAGGWGEEMLRYLREHDLHFERLRHEYLSRLDDEYRAWRRGELDTPPHRRATPPTTAASPEPSGVAMPLPAAEQGGTIEPDADAAAHHAALERFHGDPTAAR